MNPEQEQEILLLRSKNLTPKQIARKLGFKVSEVSHFLQAQAEQITLTITNSDQLNPVAQCFVNKDCFQRLLLNDSLEAPANTGGVAQVLVARNSGYNRFVIASYLVDYQCLGLKDALGPRNFNNRYQYQEFVDFAYRFFEDGYQEITLEQAQAIVWGAINYAEKLGFKPHADFEKTRVHLGEWNGEPQLQFGRNGKPFYVRGPYDNSRQVMATLMKNVGEGNFDYFMGMGD